jgi:uncharacterized iron-regulated membrane protein
MPKLRSLHRWVSTASMVFLLWIGLTGVLLAIDGMWPPSGIDQELSTKLNSAPGWINNMDVRIKLHILLQELHRGTIIGLPGHVLNIVAGCCFIFLSASGAIMFLQMLKNRRRTGKASLFWGKKITSLNVHRWLGSLFAIFLVYITVTGTLTGVAQLFTPEAQTPGMPMANGETPPKPQSTKGMKASQDGLKSNLQTKKSPTTRDSLATLFQELHAGSFFGRAGEYLMLATGTVINIMTVSGIIIYLKMYRRRRSRSKKQVFWN